LAKANRERKKQSLVDGRWSLAKANRERKKQSLVDGRWSLAKANREEHRKISRQSPVFSRQEKRIGTTTGERLELVSRMHFRLRKNVPQGLKPSILAGSAARLKPCPSQQPFFETSSSD
jgi:hypothetical protein